ncbi:uncharacterized protein LOC111025486 [Momordica charantia]|uniref:Uncharacterized protein LOC111025486 n=1 Tax=Momordica charantia TaxID=3673 RepID=A0A6J1DXI8_MOMCH|nr:uncharacterized protein LOC111025486 [Momordica charantia]
MAENSQQFGFRTGRAIIQVNEETRAVMQNLGNQITQLATWSSQPEVNPKENVSAIMTRSGKEMTSIPQKEGELGEKNEEDNLSKASSGVNFDSPLSFQTYTPSPPFPSRLAKPKAGEQENEILDTFRKELCTNKRRVKEKDKVVVSENLSAILQKNMPEKCKDPGTPFMKTARTKIDVDEGTLSVEFDKEIVKFNIFDAMKYPNDEYSLCQIDIIDSIVQDKFTKDNDDHLHKLDEQSLAEVEDEIDKEKMLNFDAKISTTNNKIIPSIVQAPKLELKALPDHLKYVYLGEIETLPVIISKELTVEQEEKLIKTLKEYKVVIGWSLADIKGIRPSICMHRILLEDETKPTREPQRRLNPTMKEVVMKEILKLLEAGIIYPISDSKWVSLIHVVPKKTGITVVRNCNNELVSMRVQNGWRMCIDFRKLNQVTRKDYFPLPFIDQMIERLAGKPFFCFPDGFSGFYQIPIAQEDQEKTTFTCSYGTYAYRRMSFGLCNAPGTFQRCMMSIFSEYIEKCIEVFMDDFTVHGESFDE